MRPWGNNTNILNTEKRSLTLNMKTEIRKLVVYIRFLGDREDGGPLEA